MRNEKRYILLVMTIINKQKIAQREKSTEPSYQSLRNESFRPIYAWRRKRMTSSTQTHAKWKIFRTRKSLTKGKRLRESNKSLYRMAFPISFCEMLFSSSFHGLFMTLAIFPCKKAKVYIPMMKKSRRQNGHICWAHCHEKDLSFSLWVEIGNVCGTFLGNNIPLNDDTFGTSAFDWEIMCFRHWVIQRICRTMAQWGKCWD